MTNKSKTIHHRGKHNHTAHKGKVNHATHKEEINHKESNELIIDSSIDQLFENMPIGSISRAIANNLYGINMRQTPAAIPRARDSYGFTFFTRPQLNLTRANISNFRAFYSLLSKSRVSYSSYVRSMLDPRLDHSSIAPVSLFVNKENPFIPILTNSLVSLSGFPDLTVPTYTTETGLYGEEVSFVDGTVNHYESYDIDATFVNYKGSPLIYMFYIWIRYQSLVFEGILNPYTDFIVENEIDYNTRIYRIVLDSQKRYVTYIAATGASFPINVPTGNLFDFNLDTPLNSNTEINIRFRCMGFLAFEDILKLEFNKTVAIFSPDMRKVLENDLNPEKKYNVSREDSSKVYRIPGCNYVKVPRMLALGANDDIIGNPFYSINYRALPYINLETNELEWFVDERLFKREIQREI